MKRYVNLPPGARSRRLDSHDYRGGAYFATTNTKKRLPLFGTVERGRMYLNECGRIVAEEWQRTGDLRDEISLDAFIVMPDHVHGLLWICHSDNDQEEDETRRKHHFQEGKQKTKDCEGEARTSREENREVPAGKDGREMGPEVMPLRCISRPLQSCLPGSKNEGPAPSPPSWDASKRPSLAASTKNGVPQAKRSGSRASTITSCETERSCSASAATSARIRSRDPRRKQIWRELRESEGSSSDQHDLD